MTPVCRHFKDRAFVPKCLWNNWVVSVIFKHTQGNVLMSCSYVNARTRLVEGHCRGHRAGLENLIWAMCESHGQWWYLGVGAMRWPGIEANTPKREKVEGQVSSSVEINFQIYFNWSTAWNLLYDKADYWSIYHWKGKRILWITPMILSIYCLLSVTSLFLKENICAHWNPSVRDFV